MARSLFALALIVFTFSQPAAVSARDAFKSGSKAYTVGMYSSAARQWLTLAEKGNRAAQYNIGRLFYYGKGVRRDRIEAYKWFLIASENGVNRGLEAIRMVEQRMTSREMAEGRVRAREWRRKKPS